jgi:hypothetical protein
MTMIDIRSIPAVTAGQMREVDRIMAEDLHIELVPMMENAGRGPAELALRRFRPATWPTVAPASGSRSRIPGQTSAPCLRTSSTSWPGWASAYHPNRSLQRWLWMP